ncbi:uncharacterized protein LOC114543898 [Dendronephthya gigantea]|uniref:uncharacterized protein LOC114543898 n=1 Tax=Dendronephthya gigantea TaxID=151771 RepID=UPI0010698E9E|nr:uncharacterized protein LOC114543898 [Dendronephthya gigantea]
MSFVLGNNLTSVAVGNLLKLLSMILPIGSRLPRTKYLFDKYFNGFREGLEHKFYCPNCQTLFQTSEKLKCFICNVEFEQHRLLEQGSFFLYLPIEKQLRDFLQENSVSDNLDYRFNRDSHNSVISDIYDGQMYRSLGDGILTSDRNALSLSFGCDGVPVFRSSSFSIWPLQGMLNELPPKIRKQHIFLIGLWFGPSKPNILQFLEPFTSEMRRLGSVGMKWLRAGVEVCSRVFACICSCDSVARCHIQNIHQFNGVNGCSWCYNPGIQIHKGQGHTRVYLQSPEGYNLRTQTELRHDATRAFKQQETVNGVKGLSKLMKLPYFDIVRGFPVDNLHCVDLGVSRQLGHLWFDSCNHQEPWYLGRHIAEIDAKLRQIIPPHEVTRIPRSVTQRAYWKGSEWHWWILLYCPIVLYGLLPSRYYHHMLLLCHGVYLLTKASITHSDLNHASASLTKFVNEFQQLYGEIHMTYNIHQLNHLTQTVIDWGPLSIYSTYVFEGFNLVLMRLFHGTQAVPMQIANSFLLYRALDALSDVSLENDGESALSFFMEAQLKGTVLLKKAKRLRNGVVALGASYCRPFTIEERFLVENDACYDAVHVEQAEFFIKAVVEGIVLDCQQYIRNSRRRNSIVGLTDGNIVELKVFAVVDSVCFAFARSISVVRPSWLRRDSECGRLCNNIFEVLEIDSVLQIVRLNNIKDKFILFNQESFDVNNFICRLPNMFDRD